MEWFRVRLLLVGFFVLIDFGDGLRLLLGFCCGLLGVNRLGLFGFGLLLVLVEMLNEVEVVRCWIRCWCWGMELRWRMLGEEVECGMG